VPAAATGLAAGLASGVAWALAPATVNSDPMPRNSDSATAGTDRRIDSWITLYDLLKRAACTPASWFEVLVLPIHGHPAKDATFDD
jgi:hypothetical protein